ncbi:MAG: phosphoribosylformylglycinamidine synthase subunit PurQ, partial [Desulfamplus sp.]|nr:phosphoribosylformylglycinamidine synthase subunit PurQ [Desulfamplus sp.]
PAMQRFPMNPNGSLHDIAGICDASGHIFGLMPHPEAYNHYTNHPDWTLRREKLKRSKNKANKIPCTDEMFSFNNEVTPGMKIFINGVNYILNSKEIHR